MSIMLAILNCLLKSTRISYFPDHKTIVALTRLKTLKGLKFRRLSSSVMDSISTFGLYKNLKTVLDELTDSKHDGIQAVQELLTIFNNAKQKFDEQNDVKKYPLIILEGLDGSGKSAMTRRLSSKIHAEKRLTPPKSISPLREFFDGHSTLRTAYYSLGNYIAALEVSCILSDKPVVMDRYWHSTTAFAVAHTVANNPNELVLPNAKDNIYKWPSDLLKPDIVLLLTVSEEIRLERHSRRNAASVTSQERLLKDDTRFRQNILQAYGNMREPGVVLVDSNGSIGRTLHLLLDTVKPLLGDLDLSNSNAAGDTGRYIPKHLRKKQDGGEERPV